MRAAALVLLAAAVGLPAAAMGVSSQDLTPGAPVPAMHIYSRCGGQNISPQLSWSGAPQGTRSFVVTMIDRDVKPAEFSHWIVVDLPPSATALPRGAKSLPAPAHAVAGNFGDAAYDGPCPPLGAGVHHYELTVWAMPMASVSIGPRAPAASVATMLAATSLDHAMITATAGH